MNPVELPDEYPSMPPDLQDFARDVKGFMPHEEGLQLYRSALAAGQQGPMLEIGTYCGKSAIYFGAGAQEVDQEFFTVDHHRGSEENQPGWEHHDPDVVDEAIDSIDTLPYFRHNIYQAGLEDSVVGIVGDSVQVARHWETDLALVFIDGGHGEEPAHNDYEHWAPKVAVGGLLLIHDVFPDPADGGRPPYEIYSRALDSGEFEEVEKEGSLRVLRRTGK